MSSGCLHGPPLGLEPHLPVCAPPQGEPRQGRSGNLLILLGPAPPGCLAQSRCPVIASCCSHTAPGTAAPAREPALQGNFLGQSVCPLPPSLTAMLNGKAPSNLPPPHTHTQAGKPSQAPVLALPSSQATVCSAGPQEVPAWAQGEERGCLDVVRCMGWCSDLPLGLRTAQTAEVRNEGFTAAEGGLGLWGHSPGPRAALFSSC